MSEKTANLYILTKGDLTIPTSLTSEKNRLLNEGFTLPDTETTTETEASKSESADNAAKAESAKTTSKK